MHNRTLLLLLTLAAVAFATLESQADPLYGKQLPSRVVADFDPGSGLPATRTTIEYAYTPNGYLVREIEESDSLSDGIVDFRLTTSTGYDARGNTIVRLVERDFHADGVFDSARHAVEEVVYHDFDANELAESVQRVARAYDPGGDLLEETRVFEDGSGNIELSLADLYTYDTAGRLASKRHVSNGGGMPDQVTTSQYFY